MASAVLLSIICRTLEEQGVPDVFFDQLEKYGMGLVVLKCKLVMYSVGIFR